MEFPRRANVPGYKELLNADNVGNWLVFVNDHQKLKDGILVDTYDDDVLETSYPLEKQRLLLLNTIQKKWKAHKSEKLYELFVEKVYLGIFAKAEREEIRKRASADRSTQKAETEKLMAEIVTLKNDLDTAQKEIEKLLHAESDNDCISELRDQVWKQTLEIRNLKFDLGMNGRYQEHLESKDAIQGETITQQNLKLAKQEAIISKLSDKQECFPPAQKKQEYQNTCRFCKRPNSCRKFNGVCFNKACKSIQQSTKQNVYRAKKRAAAQMAHH